MFAAARKVLLLLIDFLNNSYFFLSQPVHSKRRVPSHKFLSNKRSLSNRFDFSPFICHRVSCHYFSFVTNEHLRKLNFFDPLKEGRILDHGVIVRHENMGSDWERMGNREFKGSGSQESRCDSRAIVTKFSKFGRVQKNRDFSRCCHPFLVGVG